MHVVGNHGPAGCGTVTRHGPGVAARSREIELAVGLRPEPATRRRRFKLNPRLRNVRLRAEPTALGRRSPKVAYGGPRDRRHLPGFAHQRRIPAVAGREYEPTEFLRDFVEKRGVSRLPAGVVVSQIEKHRQVAEHDVLRQPRFRCGAKQQIFERMHGQRLDAGIDALCVRFKHGSFARSGPIDDRAGGRAQSVQAPLPVETGRSRSEQLRQFAGGGASQQIHLEEAFLAVNETGGPGDVDPVGAANGGHAVAIALYGHRPREAGHADFAVQYCQAACGGSIQHRRSRYEDQPHQAQK